MVPYWPLGQTHPSSGTKETLLFKLTSITLTRSLVVWGNSCYISLLAEVTLLQGETPTLLPATPTKCPSPPIYARATPVVPSPPCSFQTEVDKLGRGRVARKLGEADGRATCRARKRRTRCISRIKKPDPVLWPLADYGDPTLRKDGLRSTPKLCRSSLDQAGEELALAT